MLFGDSWVAEGGIPEGFARYLAQHGQFRCIQILNDGVGSFSPSLIMLKASNLIEQEQPILVVINIDETDLMDEWIRYRHGSVRDSPGQLIAVLPSMPDIPDFVLYYGLMIIEEQPIYLLRMMEKLYFTRVFMQRLIDIHKQKYMLPNFNNLFGPQMSLNPNTEFREPIAYFRERLIEMITRLRNEIGDRGDIVLTHHPHYLHLAEDDGKHYNDTVSLIIAEEAVRSDTPFYDAAVDFGAVHGAGQSEVFRWPEDRYSHLTHPAYVEYGHWIAQRAAPLLRARLHSPGFGTHGSRELTSPVEVVCERAIRQGLKSEAVECRSIPESAILAR